MTDLSEVIGGAIGGEMGKAVDDLIDVLREYWQQYKDMNITDTDVVISALEGLAHTTGRVLRTKPEDVTDIRNYIQSYKDQLMYMME